nr:aspartic proteinase-like protein 2 [Tanacetum cinerariifolium]
MGSDLVGIFKKEIKPNVSCLFTETYEDGSGSLGYFIKDVDQYDSVSGDLETKLANGSIIFWCGASQSGNLRNSEDVLDGIISFEKSNASVISQLASYGKVKKMFAHCLDGENGGGIFAMGRVKTKTVIDSGTTLAYLPEMIYTPLVKKIVAGQSDLSLGLQDQYTCFKYSGCVDDGFPAVTFYFENLLFLKVYPRDYLFPIREILCFGWQNNGKAKDRIILGEGYMENYKNVLQDIRDQLNAEAEAVQIILTWIANNIYSMVDACPNACEMWKSIERFYKMMNELVRNQCDVTNHQVNVQFLLQLQPEWQRFVILVKQSQKLKTVSYHKLYDILKQHQNEVNEIRAERLARTANPLALVAHRDDEMSKEREIDKLMALILYHSRKSSNLPRTISELHQTPVEQIKIILQGLTEALARECEKPKRANDVAYHKEKMLLCKQKEVGFQLNAKKADRRDDTDDEPDDQELEAHYMYMAQIQVVTLDVADNYGPIFDTEPLQKVQNDDDSYNVFANDQEYHVQPESVNDTYLVEQGDANITIDSLDMCNNRETVDQDDDNDLAKEHDLLASLIEKLKCEIDNSKNRNKFLETSNKALVDKIKGEIEDFKTKNKILESLSNHFKEANNEMPKTNQLMFKDLKKFQAELDRYHDVNYASQVALESAKAKTELMSYKTESQKSINNYSYQLNDLNQKISDMKKELVAHQETIAIM